jgi:hypothetical protein
MVALLQAVADERVSGAQDEEDNADGNEGEIEHNALPFESAKVTIGA